MKQKLLLLFFILSTLFINGQSIDRVEVKGIILSNTNDVEAVTIFNKSSNRGTITDENGDFVIKVALHDVIEISALQFQVVTITIDESVIKTKALKIQLVEQVNQLDAVTLSSGLTGNLETDIENVKMVKLTPIDLGNMDAFALEEDIRLDKSVIQNHLTSTINPDARGYLPDLVKIVGLLLPKRKKSENQSLTQPQENTVHEILEVYDQNEIQQTFNIPSENIQEFIVYIDNKINPEFFKPANEIQLIAFLFEQSKLFLEENNGKN